MSDIGIFSTFDLFAMAFVAGSPGLVFGATAGVLLWRSRRTAGLLLGGAAGFAVCLGGVLVWILWLK
jgi:low affinity Fe/Cu permease